VPEPGPANPQSSIDSSPVRRYARILAGVPYRIRTGVAAVRAHIIERGYDEDPCGSPNFSTTWAVIWIVWRST
jgi:hypothetical protein